jgi:hypothetical protein
MNTIHDAATIMVRMKDKHTGFQEGDPIKRDMTAKVTEGKSTYEHQKKKSCFTLIQSKYI